jgi:hypothetical protein
MMGERLVHQDALFYEFSLQRHVPERHLLRLIDRFVELDGLRRELAPFYSAIGHPAGETGSAVGRAGRPSAGADKPDGCAGSGAGEGDGAADSIRIGLGLLAFR